MEREDREETRRERERERERETDDPPTYSSTLRSPTGTGVHVFPIVSFLARSASHCSLLHRSHSHHPPDSLTRIPPAPLPLYPPVPPPLQLIVTDNPHDTSGLLAMVTSPTEKLRTLDNIVFYAQVRAVRKGRLNVF